ncbi:MAG: Septum site-determining protein MinD [Firmicutes bacterium ADurb.Bin193]|nr:MAG: Septum site-determining protein MinD [Firmicutes bacterium ADurb.Bin193]
MAEVIVTVSGKGGVGKTTATANIGMALASMGLKILLIDGDVGLRNLDISLGIQDRIVYHFNDVINGMCSADSAIVKDEKYIGLCYLAAPQNITGAEVNKEGFKEMVDKLRPRFDYIIIDCAAGIDDSFSMCAGAADKALIITTPELISIRDADRVAERLESMGITTVYLIINRINIDMIKKGDMIDIDTIIGTVAVPLIGAVPEDVGIIISNNKGRPLVLRPRTRAGTAFLNIAKRLTGEKVPIMADEKKGFFSFFARKR